MHPGNLHHIPSETVVMMLLKLFVCLLLLSSAVAFISNNDSRRCSLLELQMTNTNHANSRRALLAGMTAAAPVFLLSPQAQAKDEIFKANPLTNGVLEQVRSFWFFMPRRARRAVAAPK